jgi:hypothetical protein
MTTTASPDMIKEILETSLSDTAIEAYIGAANLIITQSLSSSGLSDLLLTELERWLTCHLIASTRERQVKSEETGQAKVSYDSKIGLGLDLTTYGQQCKLLDPTGLLSKLGKQAASIYAVPSFDDEEL